MAGRMLARALPQWLLTHRIEQQACGMKPRRPAMNEIDVSPYGPLSGSEAPTILTGANLENLKETVER